MPVQRSKKPAVVKRRTRRASVRRGSISMQVQENRIKTLIALQPNLESFAGQYGYPFPSLWAAEAVSMLTGHLWKLLEPTSGGASAQDLNALV